jgi:hypothetical protein
MFYRDLSDALENVWLQIKTVITSRLQELKQPEIDEQTENTIKHNILQIAKPDSSVRTLMCKQKILFVQEPNKIFNNL